MSDRNAAVSLAVIASTDPNVGTAHPTADSQAHKINPRSQRIRSHSSDNRLSTVYNIARGFGAVWAVVTMDGLGCPTWGARRGHLLARELKICHCLCVASRDVSCTVATAPSSLCFSDAQHVFTQSSNTVRLRSLVPATVAVVVQGSECGAHASLVLPLDGVVCSARSAQGPTRC